jgi:phosphoglycolate phosphatase
VADDNRRFRARAVLIDLDGTLLDTIDDLAAAANAMLVELGFEARPAAEMRRFVGKGAESLVQRALTGSLDAPIDAQRLAEAVPVFRRHYARENGVNARCYPGVVEGLAAMRANGLGLACVTNKPIAFTLPLLERTGLSPWFDVVVGGDSLPRKKPDPAQLLHACEGFGVAPSEAVMIGDSMNDALAARAAGIPVFVLPYGYNEGRPVAELDADAVIESLEHAAKLIEPLTPAVRAADSPAHR